MPGADRSAQARHWASGLACGIVFLAATPTALLTGILLLPTVMGVLADRQPGRPCARVVLLFGLAGACQPLNVLWRSGQQIDAAWALALDIHTLAIAWAAQAGGWMLTQILPILIGLAMEAQIGLVAQRLVRRRDALRAEWSRDQV
jgi:hypothetical protein